MTEETVYVSRKQLDEHPTRLTYHSGEDCGLLTTYDDTVIVERTIEELPDQASKCSYCYGTHHFAIDWKSATLETDA